MCIQVLASVAAPFLGVGAAAGVASSVAPCGGAAGAVVWPSPVCPYPRRLSRVPFLCRPASLGPAMVIYSQGVRSFSPEMLNVGLKKNLWILPILNQEQGQNLLSVSRHY